MSLKKKVFCLKKEKNFFRNTDSILVERILGESKIVYLAIKVTIYLQFYFRITLLPKKILKYLQKKGFLKFVWYI